MSRIQGALPGLEPVLLSGQLREQAECQPAFYGACVILEQLIVLPNVGSGAAAVRR